MAKVSLIHVKKLSPDVGWNQQAVAYLKLDQAKSSQSTPLFYDLNFIEDLLDCALEIIESSSIKGETSWIAQLTAIFLYSKYSFDKSKIGIESAEYARNWAKSVELPESWIAPLCESIKAYWLGPQSGQSESIRVLRDAHLAVFARKRTLKRLPLLKAEKERAAARIFSHEQWTDLLADIFLKTHFETEPARNLFDAKLKRNALNALGTAEKTDQEEDFGGENSAKSMEIFIRIQFKNVMALTSIADRKAHIMITINSITMSIIMGSILNQVEDHPNFKWPAILMLLVNFVTLVFSILAVRPSGKIKGDSKDSVGRLLFGQISYPEFKQGIANSVRNYGVFQDSLLQGLYGAGSSVSKKMWYIRTSYSIFIYGLSVVVISLCIAFFKK